MGAIAGSIVTHLGQRHLSKARRIEEQKLAAMQVASSLRQWMSLGEWMVSEMDAWQGSDGAGGKAHFEIPEFPFEKSLDHVSRLDHKTAIAVLELIHNKNEARSADEDEVVDITRGRLAQTYLEAEPLYKDLAKKVGWKKSVSANQVVRMRNEVERLERIERDRAESTASMFRDME